MDPAEERRALAARLGINLNEDVVSDVTDMATLGAEWVAVPADEVEVLPAVSSTDSDDRTEQALAAFIAAIEAGSGRKVDGIDTESFVVRPGTRRDVIRFRMR